MITQLKTGKTTTAAKFEKTLLLACEIGYLAIPNIMATPINSWSDIKSVLKQLGSDEAKEQFSNICIDTVDIAYDLCEKYICNREGVDKIGDIPYGQGYNMVSREFDEVLRAIPRAGYGLIMISHSQDKSFVDENGVEFNQIVPTLGNRPRLIVDRMSDIIAYAQPVQEEDGRIHTLLYLRQTPRFIAGSRFKYTPNSIEFTYDNLVNAIGEAIDKQAAEDDGKFVTNEQTQEHQVEPQPTFTELMAEFNKMCALIQDATGPKFGSDWAPKIVAIVERYLGRGKRASDLTPSQIEQLELIVLDLKELIGNGF